MLLYYDKHFDAYTQGEIKQEMERLGILDVRDEKRWCVIHCDDFYTLYYNEM